MSDPLVRPARPEDLPHLPAIEGSAAELFAGTPQAAAVLAAGVTDAAVWAPRQAAGTVWVVEEDAGLSAFLAAEVFGDELHVWELDVRQDRQRRGHGGRLMRHAIGWARDRGLARLTLTTYRGVPWNGPFYASLGFVELPPPELNVRLARVLSMEAEKGLDPSERCAMALELQRIGGA